MFVSSTAKNDLQLGFCFCSDFPRVQMDKKEGELSRNLFCCGGWFQKPSRCHYIALYLSVKWPYPSTIIREKKKFHLEALKASIHNMKNERMFIGPKMYSRETPSTASREVFS